MPKNYLSNSTRTLVAKIDLYKQYCIEESMMDMSQRIQQETRVVLGLIGKIYPSTHYELKPNTWFRSQLCPSRF